MEQLKWETKKVKVKDLIQLDINPRKISEEKKQKLIESLEKFNLAEIPAVNTDMQIIGGNQRVSALMMVGRGEEEIDVRVPNRKLTKKEVKEYAIISNTHAGEFDFEMLELEFSDIELADIGFDIEGMDEWQKERDNSITANVKDDEYNLPPGEIETEITHGDIIEIGPHRLLCGDSTNSDDAARLMNGKLADMVMTDPPYNVAYEGGTGLKIMNDEMSDSDFSSFLHRFYKAFADVTKDGGAWYVWHADSEGVNFRKAFTDSGLLLKQCLIWVKNALVLGRQDYHWKHEPCLYGWKKGAAHYFTDDRTQTTVIEDNIDINKLKKEDLVKILTDIMSDKTKTTVLHHDKPLINAEHPTMKPILLLAPLIANSSRQGELVADPFLGSGSTMVASHQLKRICYGMELDPKYCQVIVDRMKKLDPSLKITKNGKEWNTTKIS